MPIGPEALVRFERLWAAYPVSGRLTAGRTEALARYAELTPAEQETAIRTAVVYAATCTQLRSQAKALQRWLRDGRWRNGELALGGSGPAPDTGPGGSPLRVFVVEGSPEWEAWAAHHRRIGRPMPTPIWFQSAKADGWNFPAALPPATEKVA